VLKGRRSSGELSHVGGRQYYYISGPVETDNTSEVDIKVDTTRKRACVVNATIDRCGRGALGDAGPLGHVRGRMSVAGDNHRCAVVKPVVDLPLAVEMAERTALKESRA